MSKMFKTLYIIILAVSLLMFGFYGGSVSKGNDFQFVFNKGKETNIEKNQSDKIAVVNLDEGYLVKGENIYYSNTLSRFTSDNYKLTSLELAREGIKRGEYGAYIVIPANFSKAVESINGVPDKIVISYTLSDNLDDGLKAKMLEKIYLYVDNISVNTSYLYVSAILEDFHKVQDDSKVVLENDNEEFKELSEVIPSELWVNVEYPDTTDTVSDIEDLDVSILFSDSLDLLDAADKQISEDLQAGLGSFDDVKKDHDEVIKEINQLMSTLEEVDIFTDENGRHIYADAVRKLNSLIDTYNYLQSQKREVIRNTINTYISNHRRNDQNYLDLRLTSLLTELQNQVNEDTNNMNFNIQSYVDAELIRIQESNQRYLEGKLASSSNAFREREERMQEEVNRRVKLIVEEVREEYRESYEREWVSFWSKYEVDADGNILASASDAEIPLRVATLSDADNAFTIARSDLSYNISDILNDISLKTAVSSNYSFKNITENVWIGIPLNRINLAVQSIVLPIVEYRANDEDILSIENLYKQDFTEIKEHIDENIVKPINNESINESIRVRNEKNEIKSYMDSYEEELSTYTPYKYIKEGNLLEPVNKISSKINQAENNTNSKISEYRKYGYDLEKAKNDDMGKFIESMGKAEKDSVYNIEKTINDIKERRKNINAENVELLKAFSEKLAYTKMGENDNTKVYDFIVNPVSTQELDIEKSSATEMINEIPKSEDVKYLYISLSLMFVGMFMYFIKVNKSK